MGALRLLPTDPTSSWISQRPTCSRWATYCRQSSKAKVTLQDVLLVLPNWSPTSIQLACSPHHPSQTLPPCPNARSRSAGPSHLQSRNSLRSARADSRIVSLDRAAWVRANADPMVNLLLDRSPPIVLAPPPLLECCQLLPLLLHVCSRPVAHQAQRMLHALYVIARVLPA